MSITPPLFSALGSPVSAMENQVPTFEGPNAANGAASLEEKRRGERLSDAQSAPAAHGGMALLAYLTQTEVHTYAFSVAANAILSIFPFIVMMFTLARQVFHSRAMESVIREMIRHFLPVGQEFVIKNMAIVAHAHRSVQMASVMMLLISSTGVFMPLECALNRIWGVTKNRSYLMNQIVAFGLALAIAALVLADISFTAAQRSILPLFFLGSTHNALYGWMTHWLLQISASVVSILFFFLIYWILPNRRLPALAVLPTAVVVGLLWEVAKIAYTLTLPWLNFQEVYGPFFISVSLMMWAFLSGLLLLAGAHCSATRHARRMAELADWELRRKTRKEQEA